MARMRNSRIELLKIIAIVMIVINHAVQTATVASPQEDILNTGLLLMQATVRIDHLLLVLFRHFGAIANGIFALSSFYFLCADTRVKADRVIAYAMDCWIISVGIMLVTRLCGVSIEKEQVLSSIFPLTFNNNWYITCYILIYLSHGILNTLLDNLDNKRHFLLLGAMLVLYCGFGMLSYEFYYYTHFMLFLTLYVYISYQRKYLSAFAMDVKANVRVLAVGVVGSLLLILATDFLGLRISFMSDKMFFWAKSNNPLLLMVALALFNLSLSGKPFEHKGINYIAGLSLSIYLIHENIVSRQIWRHQIWEYLYLHMKDITHGNVVAMLLTSAACVFVVSLVLAMLYRLIAKRLLQSASAFLAEHFELIMSKVVR